MKKFFYLFFASILFFSCSKDKLSNDVNAPITYQNEIYSVDQLSQYEDSDLNDFFSLDFIEEYIEDDRKSSTPRGDNDIVDLVRLDIANKNIRKQTVKQWIKKYGFPAWNRFFEAESTNKDFRYIYIPFIKRNRDSKAFLEVVINDGDYRYKFTNFKKLQKYSRVLREPTKDVLFSIAGYLISMEKLHKTKNKFLLEYLEENSNVRETNTSRCNTTIFLSYTICAEYYYYAFTSNYNGDCKRWMTVNVPVTMFGDCTSGGGGLANPYDEPGFDGDGSIETIYQMNILSQLLGFSARSKDWAYLETQNQTLREGLFACVDEYGEVNVTQFYNTLEQFIFPGFTFQMAADYAALKYLKKEGIKPYANEYDLTLMWRAFRNNLPSRDQFHTALDIIGLLPVIGEAADFANATFYLIEGDGVNAAVSLSATIPLVGWGPTGTRLAVKSVKYGRKKVTQAVFKDGNLIYFAKTAAEDTYEIARSSFRTVMQTPSGYIAHHVITHKFRQLPIIQKAAKSGKFHINDVINGFNIDKALHKGYSTAHRTYDNSLREKLLEFNRIHGHKSYDEINRLLSTFIDDIKQQLAKGKQLDQINFNIPN